MTATECIKAERVCGVVRCGVLDRAAPLEEILAAFSLSGPATQLRRIGKEEAIQIVANLLHEDLAYKAELMPQSRAAALAEGFLSPFGQPSAQFFTNLDPGREWKENLSRRWTGFAWNPMTKATFDAGVIAVSQTQSACFWVEDED